MTEAAAAVVEFELGDRVVLHGLEGAAHLNKCHGVVAAKKKTTINQQDSHLYAVHLDILKTLWIKPGNLTRENEMSKYTLQNRAPVVDGVLTQRLGKTGLAAHADLCHCSVDCRNAVSSNQSRSSSSI